MIDDPAAARSHPPGSPLDPFLNDFLRVIDDLAGGYAPTAHQRAVTSTLDWPNEFADAIFTSARARGMVETVRGPGTRGRSRWRLSARGRVWLAATDPADDAPQPISTG